MFEYDQVRCEGAGVVDGLPGIIHFMKAEFEVDNIRGDVHIFEIGDNCSHWPGWSAGWVGGALRCERILVAIDEHGFGGHNIRVEELPMSGSDAEHDFAGKIIEVMKTRRELCAIYCQAVISGEMAETCGLRRTVLWAPYFHRYMAA